MKRRKLRGRDQRGETSMVTVGMFMMLFSVIVVSFTFMAINTARTTLNDTLQSTAKAAAESGVEDAKRLLIYCYGKYKNSGSLTNEGSYYEDGKLCSQVIGHTIDEGDCNSILSQTMNTSSSVISNVEQENNDYRVSVGEVASAGDDGTNREYYQCLKIATRSKDYLGLANEGRSLIIPLNLVDSSGQRTNASEITIEWHKNSIDADGIASGLSDNDGLPNKSNWLASGNRPAVMRAEVLFVANGNTSVTELQEHDYALTLRPASSGSSSIGMMNYNSYQGYREQPNVQTVPFSKAKCSNGSGKEYSCSVTLTGLRGDSVNNGNAATNMGYLRLLTTYKGTHVKVTAKGIDGRDLFFDGVQPIVDVTGKSSDTFSRIQARLKPVSSDADSASSWFPEYAVQTDGKICKKLNVFWETGDDECNYD